MGEGTKTAVQTAHTQAETITLYEDTRNQVGQHRNVEEYCSRMGIILERKCLNVGDYMFPDEMYTGQKISIDSKADILELCHNVMSRDHRRFKAECIRAQEQNIKLIVLVEEVPPFGRLDMWEVPTFKHSNRFHRFGDPMTLVKPATLRKACISMQERYGVCFRFCQPWQTPARIIKYLKGEIS